MTSVDTSSSTSRPSMGDIFLAHLAVGDFDRLAVLFEPDVSLRALLPGGLREWHGREQVADAFVGWFGRVEEFALVEAAVGQVGPRLQLQWRARVRGASFGDGSFVVEQHVYADAGPSGRVQSMSMLCSGFTEERVDE